MAQIFCLASVNNQILENNNEGLGYLKKLFNKCKNGYIEILPVPPGGKRQWIPVNNIVLLTLPDKDIYVGVATRTEGKGTKNDIIEIPAVWMDLDFKNRKEEDVCEKLDKVIDEFKLQPSMTVRSGNGLHLYWILEEPATYGDIGRIEDINKRLAAYLSGDMASTDAAHKLRLPGTRNHKYDPPRDVLLESNNNNLYKLSDFDFLPPVKSDAITEPSTSQNADVASTLLDGVHQGERHNRLVSLAGRYQKLHLPIEETKWILHQWNAKNMPPLEVKELTKTIDDVYSRYNAQTNSIAVTGYTDYCSVIEQSAMKELDFMRKSFPARPSIIDPFLKNGEIGMISAARGAGKTWCGLLIATMATRTMEVGRWKTKTPTGCLYIDGEMSAEEMQNRILELEKSYPPTGGTHIKFLSADDMRNNNLNAPNLSNADCREGILDYLKKHEDIRLLILDNISCLTPRLDENIRKDWDDVSQWLLQLRSIGTAVILVHHEGKNNMQRGTSAREDLLNFSIRLKRPEGYNSEEGARFIVEFTKNRRFYGPDAKPFELELQNKNMKLTWTVNEDGNKKEDDIIDMLNEGKQQKAIAEELEVTQSYVSQVKKTAKEEGKLKEKKDIQKDTQKKRMENLHKDLEIN